MAAAESQNTGHVTLRLQGSNIPALALSRALEAFVRLLQAVGDDDAAATEAPMWIIDNLASGSAVATLRPGGSEPMAAIGETIVDWTMAGLRSLEAPSALTEPPPHFSPSALEEVRKLLAVTGDGDEVEGIAVSAPETDVTLTRQSLANVESFIGSRYSAYTGIDGMLQVLSVREGLHVGIKDAATSHLVRSSFPEDMLPSILTAFNRRVRVWGVGRYSQHGQLVSIKIEEIRVQPADHELPTVDEIIGLVPDLTGGRSLEDYMHQLRDAR